MPASCTRKDTFARSGIARIARRMPVMGGKWRRAGSRHVGYIPVCPGWYDGDVTGSTQAYASFRPKSPPKIGRDPSLKPLN